MDYEYITTPSALAGAIQRFTGSPVLGVDTEAAGYHRYHDRISLIQISSDRENVLIDPLEIDDLGGLAALFEDSSVEKIFHDADFDLRILDRDVGLRIHNLFDTQIAASFVGARGLGLGAVVEEYLGIDLPKAYQRADWAERPLSEGMKTYAAKDTAYLPPLREKLIERLEALGRRSWAEEEFERREETRWVEPDDNDEAFLRIKGARDLSPRGLAILRELHEWRERVGEERDQATFRILSNSAMIEIGLTAPSTQAELKSIRGMSSALVQRRGQELLAAVKRGLAVPEGELPHFPPSQRWERDLELEALSERLRQMRNRMAKELNLDPGFLMSRAVLEEVGRHNPKNLNELEEVPEVRRWQVEALGEQIMDVLKG